MKEITMFVLDSCPYCKQAYRYMKELTKENPEYAKLDIRIIDEEKYPDIAERYDYYYVPAYYANQLKLHEGIPQKDIIRDIFERALK